MQRTRVTIIGMGPRGLSVLERIAAFARASKASLELHLIDPGECGPGAHHPQQPQHLLINTVASQITIFPWREAVAHPPVCATPSLTEWASAQGYRRFGEQFHQAGPNDGAAIGEGDYLPRQLLGRYLAWAYRQIAASLPATCSLRHHRQRAVDLRARQGEGYAVELQSGFVVATDYVFLATGHSRNILSDDEAVLAKFAREHARINSKLAYIRHVYPLQQLASIPNDASVAIQGLGLTAHDVIAELTVGRGGAFTAQGYLKSGQEPSMVLYSRNCLPAAARGINQKGLCGRHQARFFTKDAVLALRRQHVQLDFDRELLPLMLKEMAYAWRCVADGAAPEAASYRPSADDVQAIEQLLWPLNGRHFESPGSFRSGIRQLIEQDLQEALRGNLCSPAKAAADVLRDIRASLQEAIEHGGLNPISHRRFLSVYNTSINRISFGPPRQRNAQLLALLDAGVVRLAPGPNPSLVLDEEHGQFKLRAKFPAGPVEEAVDVLVVARLDPYLPELDDSILSEKLLARGLLRPYFNGAYHPGGLDIDGANHPRTREGKLLSDFWAIGYPVEGAHYYTHALPRPGLAARAVLDADRCVRELFSQIESKDTSCNNREERPRVS